MKQITETEIRRLLTRERISATPEKQEETITRCKQITRASHRRMVPRVGFWGFLAEVFHREGLRLSLGQAGVLICACILLRGANEAAGLLPVLSPLFLLAAYPTLFSAARFGMSEIEAVTKHSNIELILAKLLILAASDLCCFTVLVFAANAVSENGGGLFWMLLYVLVPYIFCLGMLLMFLRRFGGGGYSRCVLGTLLSSVFLAGVAFWLPQLYRVSAGGFWVMTLLVFAYFLGRELVRSVVEIKEGKIYGVVA